MSFCSVENLVSDVFRETYDVSLFSDGCLGGGIESCERREQEAHRDAHGGVRELQRAEEPRDGVHEQER